MAQNRYTVVTIRAENPWLLNKTAEEFSHKVEEMLFDGWKPIGGVSIDSSGNVIFPQAIVKD